LENQIPKIGVNVFVIKDNKILLGKRIGKTGFGTWCLPGGHFEFGESLIDAAKRELKEETGLSANKLEFLHLINDPLEKVHYVHINFIAKDFEGVPVVAEKDKFSEWTWFEIDNLPEPIFVGHKKFVPALLSKDIFIDTKK
jgi:8-oxo-dGTP diphosphatase